MMSPPRHLAVTVVTFVTIGASASAQQFRGVWADAFHPGYKSAAEIDSLVARAAAGGYNAILPEVLAFHDDQGSGHGAYWTSDLVPRASDIAASLDDPLAYLIEQAHAAGLEVHAWIVTYRAADAWPPPGNTILAAHPEWFMVSRADAGDGPAPADGAHYVLDPGCPEVQEYLVSIVREIAENYAIDGIHWDYVRYTQKDAGYPADLDYSGSSLARFQALQGYSGLPPTDGSTAWDDFRRQTIDEHVRRMRVELDLLSASTGRTLRHSAALITWGDAPLSFESSSAYGLFQNWDRWLRYGWLDAACPMAYYREHNATHAEYFRNWVDGSLYWKHDRHLFVGQATYLNSMANSLAQLNHAIGEGADGVLTYSYNGTADENLDGSWESDWTWYTYIGEQLFETPMDTPDMPWRDPETATEGTIYGQVTLAETGEPLDGATITIPGRPSVVTDGNGYFAATMAPATAEGTDYDLSATHGTFRARTAVATVMPASLTRVDLALGPFGADDPDGDDIPADEDNCPDVANLDQADEDNDGAGDDCDGCPSNPSKTDVGSCGCDVAETDTDSDGFPNCVDNCDNDPAKSEPGACGCGVADVDADSDGVADCDDDCTNTPAGATVDDRGCAAGESPDATPTPTPGPNPSGGCGAAGPLPVAMLFLGLGGLGILSRTRTRMAAAGRSDKHVG